MIFAAAPVALWLWRAALTAPRPGRASFWVGWAFGAGHFSVALHWIVEPFLVDAAAHGWMAPFAFIILNARQQVQDGLIADRRILVTAHAR